jgi:HAD superfamily hydrolase (TIGR01549 family)
MTAAKHQAIKVITFDLDDTLWEVTPVLIEAERIVFDWLVTNAGKIGDQFSAQSLRDWKWKLYQQQSELSNKISEMRIYSVEQALLYVGYNAAESAKISQEAFDIFLDARHNVTLFDDVIPMLEVLGRQYSLGVLTNGNADISRLEIGALFDFSFSAEQLNASKPAPEHFQAAQQFSGASAHEIIHVGDHIDHDIAGARLAGCHAIWFNPDKKPRPTIEQTFMEVHSLAELPATIERFEQQLITK